VRGRQIVITMPRTAFRALCPGAARLHGTVLRTPSGGILADHMMSLVEELPTLAVWEAPTVERSLVALVANAINGSMHNGTGHRSPLVDTPLVAARVRRHIEDHLTDPALSAESLRAQLGLSKSGLSRAFGSPAQLTAHIRGRRLAVAREMIVESVMAPDPADLARIFCFRDAAEFERAFVRHIGCPPAEARRMVGSR
jgi:AraC-like DNA-binding protein